MNRPIEHRKQSFLRTATLQVFPMLKQERTQSFLIVVFTFLALIIFGLFAINPTVATIIQLRKQLADNILVEKTLQEKIVNLSTLQQKYDILQPDLPLVLAAMPDSHNMPELIGQIQAMAVKNKLALIALQTDPLTLQTSSIAKASTFSFSFTIQGDKKNILNFITSFTSFDRITTIYAILLSTTGTGQNDSQATIQGNAFFKAL